MNKLYTLFLTLMFITNLKAEIGLYTSESDNIRPVSEMYNIIKEYIEKDGHKDILYYVHGRKKNVEDEIKRMKKIESLYDVKVIMLHWDSYESMFTRPVENARIASDSLHETFEMVKRAKSDFREYFEEHQINILAHSMGNIIVKFNAEKYYLDLNINEDIFTNFISVGADVPLKDHQVWLSKFNISKNKFIMLNNSDIVLLSSYGLDLNSKNPSDYRLGLGFDNSVAKREESKNKLDQKSYYVDMSKLLSFNHGYFISKNKVIQSVFSQILNNRFLSHELNSNYRMVVDAKEKNYITILKP